MNPADAIGIGIFLLLVLAIVLVYNSNQQAQRNAMRRALIEKFGSAQDLGTFLQTSGGRQFMADLSTGNASASILASVQKGIILFLLGFGFASAGGMNSAKPVVGIGAIICCTGIGFLVSAVVTYIMSRAMGLISKKQES
jgi:hypothetical protein